MGSVQIIELTVGTHRYQIKIAPRLLRSPQTFATLCPGQMVMVVSDSNVAPLYAEVVCDNLLSAGVEVDRVVLPDGEQNKTLAAAGSIFNALMTGGFGRDATLLALGGGVVSDLTGFAAACYQRGVNFISIPTTLLAQVDAAIGGKTAVNHPLGKNMIGLFHHPSTVLIDPDCLTTLPKRQISSGLAEIIKYGMALDGHFFSWLEEHLEQLLQLEMQSLVYAIGHCCKLKMDLVIQDERDFGRRQLLNFGHTFGHAIESYLGYTDWLHGEAIAAGMVMAAATAESLGLCRESEVERLMALLRRANLPITGPQRMQLDDYLTYLWRDKKVRGHQLQFVLPTTIGRAEVRSVAVGHLRSVLDTPLTKSVSS